MSVEVELPIIDVAELLKNPEDAIETVKEIGTACRDLGFFYIKNHGVDTDRFLELSRGFFDLPHDVKQAMHIKKSKNAYRGYFGHCEEKTDLNSPARDWKEGAYFSLDFPDDHPGVLAGKPLHGKNMWPAEEAYPGFRKEMERYYDQLSDLGFVLMSAMARTLGLDKDYFKEKFFSQAYASNTLLHYFPLGKEPDGTVWGVGEHTDYGVLTLVLQDDVGGLQAQTKAGKWIDVPPVDGTFVINLGDVLEVWADGAFTARPHRVKLSKDKDRYSIAYFFEPNVKTRVSKITCENAVIDIDPSLSQNQRKLGMELPFDYGDYLTYKFDNQFEY